LALDWVDLSPYEGCDTAALRKGHLSTEIEGRPSLLTVSEMKWMQAKIYERFCIHKLMTSELLDEIEIETGKFILPDTLRKLLPASPHVALSKEFQKRRRVCSAMKRMLQPISRI
jgi:hypothetical protein